MAAKLFLDERNLKQLGFTEPNIRTMRALTDFLNVQNTVTTVVGPIEAITTTGLLARVGLNQWATRTLTGPASGITVTNGDGVADNPTLALANDLAALEGLAANGLIARTGDGSAAVRTITGGTGITVSNGDGVSGNPTISTSISQYTDEQVRDVIGAALVAGSNVTITVNDAGDTITIAASGGGSAAWTLKSTFTWSTNVTQVDFTGLAGANEILIIFKAITLGTSGVMTVRCSTDNGSNFFAGASDYSRTDHTGTTSNQTFGALGWDTNATAAREGTITILGANVANAPKIMIANAQTGFQEYRFNGDNANDVDAVRCLPQNGGNITGGTIYCLTR